MHLAGTGSKVWLFLVNRSAMCSNYGPAIIKLPTLLPVYAVRVATAFPNLAGAAGPGARISSGYQVVHAIAHNKPGPQGGGASRTGVVVDFDWLRNQSRQPHLFWRHTRLGARACCGWWRVQPDTLTRPLPRGPLPPQDSGERGGYTVRHTRAVM